jgi:hypothetical protein
MWPTSLCSVEKPLRHGKVRNLAWTGKLSGGRRKSEERTSLTAEQDNDDRRKSRAEDQRTGKLDNSGAQRSGNLESQTDLAL